MLDRLRKRLDSSFAHLGTSFARLGPSPTAWTAVGVLVSLLAGYSFWTSFQVAGGPLILLSGFFDVVDGAVARVTGKTSRRGAFLDSTLDRVAEVVVFLGIMEGGLAEPAVVLVALSLSLLVSYTRARAESLGTALAGVGVGERSERLLVLAIMSILGYTGYGVAAVAVLAGFTLLERVYRASKALG